MRKEEEFSNSEFDDIEVAGIRHTPSFDSQKMNEIRQQRILAWSKMSDEEKAKEHEAFLRRLGLAE